ncbi:MAG TPA: deoxyribonuclease IV [Longimicrobiaceae bacterium]|nr:deoxyribonuclease IV [Longimicrobiaceae bacterium]
MLLLGAHVSSAGGVQNAPARAAEIGANAFQLFTKQPSRWAEPVLAQEQADAFRAGIAEHDIGFTVVHDSYLINLATPDATLRDRSLASFIAELRRADALGLDAVVTHPGNATDGDAARGLAQNAALIEQAMAEVGGTVRVLLETTAGAGKVLGASFEQLAEMIERIAPRERKRVGICFDTCHVYAAGYDLVEDYDGVFARLGDVVGLERVGLFHLNDSLHPLGSRKDRHAEIGEGTLGDEPFRRLMRDERFAAVPKVLETPKGDDAVVADRRNLARLRAFLA